jgi:cytochrome c2
MLNYATTRIFTRAIVLAAALGLSGPAAAADAGAGAEVAKRWCGECHDIGSTKAARDVGPTFTSIANDPKRTDQHLRTWLADPHPPMPNPGLSRRDIEDVIAYLASLRKK